MSGELQNKYSWLDFTASTSGRAVDFMGFGLENTFYFDAGAASSGAVTVQTARTSTGPWTTIGSTTVSSTGGSAVLQITGPYMFVRPTVVSTGTWQVEVVSFG